MNLDTKIAGIKFKSPILNASGVNDTSKNEIIELANSSSAGVVLKSCTIEPREGNIRPRCAQTDLGIIQSMGWPNLGYKKYLEILSELKKETKKPIVASVAGFCDEDYIKIVKAFQKSEVDMIEISLSCPNIEDHPQLGYDFAATEKLLQKLVGLGKKPIGLKLPPYLDFALQEKMAELIIKYKISFITVINSPGNAMIIDPEKEEPVIKPRGGTGGLCGEYIKPLALGNVRGFYQLLKNHHVSIIGVGGIKNGTDVFAFLLAGADAVQIGTTLEREGTSSFERIENELREIIKRKNYSKISDILGKLKS